MLLTLMNKRFEVLDFELDVLAQTVMGVSATYDLAKAPLSIWNERISTFRSPSELAPLVNRWWQRRGIPLSRIDLKLAGRLAGFDSPRGLALAAHAFSLSDQYWVRPRDAELGWDQGNFFTNAFDDEIGLVLAGVRMESGNPSHVSPSSTAEGNLPKRWTIDQVGVRRLLKGGSGALRQEPFNEAVATALYRRILPAGSYVPYTLVKEGERWFSSCPCFVDESHELVAARDVYWSFPGNDASMNVEGLVRACDGLGAPGMRDLVNRLLVCDYLLGNIDRHDGNFGLMRNVDTGAFEGAAPVFDSGLSLLCYGGDASVSAADVPSNPFMSFQHQQLALVDDFSWLDCGALRGFADEAVRIVSACPSRYMDDDRLAYLGAFIESGVSVIERQAAEPPACSYAQKATRAVQIREQRVQELARLGYGPVLTV